MGKLTDPLIAELEQEAGATRRCLERVPEDKLTWKPHEKSMSLGQLALHIAQNATFLSEALQQDSFQMPEFTQVAGETRAQILEAHDEGIRKAKEFLSNLDDEKALANWKVTNEGKVLMEAPRIGMIRGIMLNHWYHHRGMLSVYLRLLDVPVPSVYGPSADENPWA